MRKSRFAVALIGVALTGAVYAKSAHAAASYWDCLAAASYGLSECIGWAQHPDATFTSADCWETYFYLRDDPTRCHQFPAQ